MTKENETKYVVLNEKQIKQKMAGYKSAYTKMIKSAKTSKERKVLENHRESFLAEKLNEINLSNKKAIQQRAGHLSWITRRANQAIKNSKVSSFNNTKKVSNTCHTSKKNSKKVIKSCKISTKIAKD